MKRTINLDSRFGLDESITFRVGPKRRDRAAQGAASAANKTAGTTAGTYGSQAGQISSTLLPFETEQLLHPTGESQRDIGAQLTAGLAGTGGAASALTGTASKVGATTRNPMGFSSALDSAARERMKAAAGVGSGIAAENAKVKLGQQSDAGKTLAGLYGTDVDAQLKSQGQQADDINAEVNAGKSGWLQNMNSTLGTLTDAYKVYKGQQNNG